MCPNKFCTRLYPNAKQQQQQQKPVTEIGVLLGSCMHASSMDRKAEFKNPTITDDISFNNWFILLHNSIDQYYLFAIHFSDCPVRGCTFEYDPQCGSDGQSYVNLCVFHLTKCNNLQLEIAYRGPCQGKEISVIIWVMRPHAHIWETVVWLEPNMGHGYNMRLHISQWG